MSASPLPAATPSVQCRGCYQLAPATLRYCPACQMQLPTASPEPIMPAFSDPLTAAPAPQTGRARNGRMKRLLGPLAPVAYVALKFKGLLFVLYKSKVALSMLSMVVSIWAYAAAWGLGVPAAIGFVALILIHELGHALAFRLKGVAVEAPVFIPFLGAYVRGRTPLPTLVDFGDVALAGPLAGTAAALACSGLGVIYGGPLWPYLSFVGLYLNLFNLIPIGFLDGGHIARAVSPWLWLPGMAVVAYLIVQHPNPVLVGVAVVGGWQVLRTLFGRRQVDPRPAGPVEQRVLLGLVYFALVAFLAVMLVQNPLSGWGAL